MSETAAPRLGSLAIAPDLVVWEDEIWVLARHQAADGRLGLTLHARDDEELGQLDDEHASQLGRIANRLVRIVEHLPGAGPVAIGRVSGPHVNLTFEVAGVDADELHTVAVKLANWGGDARA